MSFMIYVQILSVYENYYTTHNPTVYHRRLWLVRGRRRGSRTGFWDE